MGIEVLGDGKRRHYPIGIAAIGKIDALGDELFVSIFRFSYWLSRLF